MNYTIRHKKILLVLLGSACALIFAEIAFRIVDMTDYNKFKQDTTTGLLTYRPLYSFYHAESCFENVAETNNLGFHGTNVEISKPEGTYRIVVLGNSFVEALQVGNNKIFTTLLEEKLNEDHQNNVHYEVVPIAFSGNGTYLNNMYYYRFGSMLEPNLVVLMLTGDELRKLETYRYQPSFDSNDNLILELPEFARDPNVIFLKDIARKSKLFMNVKQQLQNLEEHMNALYTKRILRETIKEVPGSSPEVSATEIDRLWGTEQKLLYALANQVRAGNGKLILSAKINRDIGTTTAALIAEKYQSFSDAQDVPLVFLNQAFTKSAEKSGKDGMFTCDWHWDADGHTYIAEGLYEYLKNNEQLIEE